MNTIVPRDPKWVGFELHDGLLQWVIGARMHLEVAIAAAEDPELNHRLQQTKRIMEYAIDEGRQLIGYLEQGSLRDAACFEDSLRRFIATLNLPAEQIIELAQPQPAWPELPDTMAWNLLRIAQQAVQNSVQHAGPATICIALGWKDHESLSLEISDDGVGYAQREGSPSDHFGISSMRHRAQLIGAQLAIQSAPGGGCSIKVTVAIA